MSKGLETKNSKAMNHSRIKNVNAGHWCIKIIRTDYWIKNILVLVAIMGASFYPSQFTDFDYSATRVLLALFSVCLLASANYAINEFYDRKSDRYHFEKHNRVLVQNNISGLSIFYVYSIVALLGLSLAYLINREFMFIGGMFLISGLLYNIPMIRLKDIPVLDIFSESLNSVLRFYFGWAFVRESIHPPLVPCLIFFIGAAFLVTLKRYSEYKNFSQKSMAVLYRKSFSFYNEHNLMLLITFFGFTGALVLGYFYFFEWRDFLFLYPFNLALFGGFIFKVFVKKESEIETTRVLKTNYINNLLILNLFIFLIIVWVTANAR